MTNVLPFSAPTGRRRAVTTVTLDRDWCGDPEETFQFVHPLIEPRFSSPLVNVRNYEIAGDAGWERLAERVCEQLKPVAFVDGYSWQMRKAIKRVRAAGGHGRVYSKFGLSGHLTGLTISGVIGDVFDLDALLADYDTYLRHDETVSAIAAELQRIAPLRFSDFDAFGLVECTFLAGYDRVCREPGSLARCGLLCGYPVETTVALIGTDWQLPGFDHTLHGHERKLITLTL